MQIEVDKPNLKHFANAKTFSDSHGGGEKARDVKFYHLENNFRSQAILFASLILPIYVGPLSGEMWPFL